MRNLLFSLFFLAFYLHAESSCTATNTNGDQTCSINCPTGQAATCQNATGGSTPSCFCSSASFKQGSFDIKSSQELPIIKAKLECVSLVLGNGSGRLVNSCNKCMVAMFSDYNGGVRNIKIPAYGYVDVQGSGTLVADHECQ
ncbi:TPA: hypothetical protein KE234_000492 [Citrobacter koseri]|uniref:hypothetical protein n=1 Tax=Citrobacter koseri TaxID=545 RepID=UPI001BA37A8F|nr:hypothetical protein [Citrobacter koseri]HBC7342169.1 hypothetical protein [Citrobacter koseri]HBC8644024.1 hypothetical protein [Citrobacter koseri]